MTPEEFNDLYSVGTSVNYHPVIGQPEHKKVITYSDAWISDSGEPVIQVKGQSGYVSLRAISVDPEVEKYAHLGRKIMSHAGECTCGDCKAFLEQGDVVREMGLQA